MGHYLLNQETQKLELHFTKAEYMALSESQKSEIKSYFLFSKTSSAWVSRSIHNHCFPEQIAIKLGLENKGKIGERLSYAEELERKAEKAEARAERYEEYSKNADKRAESLQADFNKYRKDWSWLTQPIIAGHAGSRAFANHRNRVMARYEKGFEEYKKSEYFQDRAATARRTANNSKLQDRVYLHNRIKECNKTLKQFQDLIGKLENNLYRVQQGEILKNYKDEILTEERLENSISEALEKYDWEYDKLEFFQGHLEEIGGIQFSKENIQVGDIVKITRWGRCEIAAAGPVNITYKILDGDAAGGYLTDPYAVIESIITEAKKKPQKIEIPFKVNDILVHYSCSGNAVLVAYQVIKVTTTGVKIQRIAVEDNKPIFDKFTGETPKQKKVVKSKFSEFVGVYDGDRQLYKYTA